MWWPSSSNKFFYFQGYSSSFFFILFRFILTREYIPTHDLCRQLRSPVSQDILPLIFDFGAGSSSNDTDTIHPQLPWSKSGVCLCVCVRMEFTTIGHHPEFDDWIITFANMSERRPCPVLPKWWISFGCLFEEQKWPANWIRQWTKLKIYFK